MCEGPRPNAVVQGHALPMTDVDLGTPSAAQRRRIRALDGLVLGDFASIARQAWFTPGDSNVEWLVEALSSELRTRGEGGARLGF